MCSCSGHGEKTGTNLHAALHRVNEVMSFFKENGAQYHFNQTQNVIVIATDGKHALAFPPGPQTRSQPGAFCLPAGFSNTGTDPRVALLKIRNLLGYHGVSSEQKHETLLGNASNRIPAGSNGSEPPRVAP